MQNGAHPRKLMNVKNSILEVKKWSGKYMSLRLGINAKLALKITLQMVMIFSKIIKSTTLYIQNRICVFSLYFFCLCCIFSTLSGDTPLGHVTSNFDGGHMTRNDPKMVISGHLIFIKMADNMAKWGVPRKSNQNAAQGKNSV